MIRFLIRSIGWALLAAVMIGYFMAMPPAPDVKPSDRVMGTVIAHIKGTELLVHPRDGKDSFIPVSQSAYNTFRDGDPIYLVKTPTGYQLAQ